MALPGQPRPFPDPNGSRFIGAQLPSGATLSNLDRDDVTNSGVTITSGTMRVCGVVAIPANRTLVSATIYSGATAGATLTHSWMGVVRVSDRALIAVSPDNTGATWAINTPRTFTFSASLTTTTDTQAWLAVVVAGTTMPTFWGSPAPAGGVTTITALAPVLEGNSTTALTTPQALNTVETAPTATALGVPYVYLI